MKSSHQGAHRGKHILGLHVWTHEESHSLLCIGAGVYGFRVIETEAIHRGDLVQDWFCHAQSCSFNPVSVQGRKGTWQISASTLHSPQLVTFSSFFLFASHTCHLQQLLTRVSWTAPISHLTPGWENRNILPRWPSWLSWGTLHTTPALWVSVSPLQHQSLWPVPCSMGTSCPRWGSHRFVLIKDYDSPFPFFHLQAQERC